MILHQIISFASDESGTTAIEYGVIASLISVAAAAALQALGNSIIEILGIVSSTLVGAATS